MSVPTSQPSLL